MFPDLPPHSFPGLHALLGTNDPGHDSFPTKHAMGAEVRQLLESGLDAGSAMLLFRQLLCRLSATLARQAAASARQEAAVEGLKGCAAELCRHFASVAAAAEREQRLAQSVAVSPPRDYAMPEQVVCALARVLGPKAAGLKGANQLLGLQNCMRSDDAGVAEVSIQFTSAAKRDAAHRALLQIPGLAGRVELHPFGAASAAAASKQMYCLRFTKKPWQDDVAAAHAAAKAAALSEILAEAQQSGSPPCPLTSVRPEAAALVAEELASAASVVAASAAMAASVAVAASAVVPAVALPAEAPAAIAAPAQAPPAVASAAATQDKGCSQQPAKAPLQSLQNRPPPLAKQAAKLKRAASPTAAGQENAAPIRRKRLQPAGKAAQQADGHKPAAPVRRIR